MGLGFHTVGLKADGTCVAIGRNNNKQCDVSIWKDIVQVSCGEYGTIGLKSNGTCVAIGDNDFSQLNITDWKDIIQITCGRFHTVGLKADGTCVAIGKNDYGQLNVTTWTNIKQISCGNYHTIGLKKDGTCVAIGYNDDGQCNIATWKDIISLMCDVLFKLVLPKYLLKQSNQYYTIKSQFYDGKIYKPCSKDFANNGFDDLNGLIENVNEIERIGIKDVVNEVNVFKFNVGNYVNKIEVM